MHKNFLRKIFVVAMSAIAFVNISEAAEIRKDGLTISYISALAEKTSTPSSLSGAVLIGFNDVSWLPSQCKADGVYVKNNQQSILAIALKAMELNKTVQVRIESGIVKERYCEAIYLLMFN